MLIIQCDVEGCEEKANLPSSNGFRGNRLPEGWLQLLKMEKPERDPREDMIVKRRPFMMDPMGLMPESGDRPRSYSICPNHPIPKFRELPADEIDDFVMTMT